MNIINYPYLVVSDIHFHDWDFGSYTTTEGINSRLLDSLNEFRRAIETLEEAGGKDVVITGDMFHVRGIIKPSIYNPVYEMFKEFEGRINVHAIPGNHDLETEESCEKGTSFASFASIKGWNIYYSGTYLKIGEDEIGIMLPWFEDVVKLDNLIKHYNTGIGRPSLLGCKPLTLFMHVGLNDVVKGVMGSFSPEFFYDNFKGLKYAFSGHFHNHKHFRFERTTGSTDIYSVGALTHQAFRDVGSKAGFLIVYEDTVVHHGSKAPKFVDYTDTHWLYPEKLDISKFQGNFVRINLNSNINQEDIEKIKVTLNSLGAYRVINRSNVGTKSEMREEDTTPVEYVLGQDKPLRKTKISDQFEAHINAKYNKIMANKIWNILKEEEYDE